MIRVLPFAAAAAHGLLCCWLAASATRLWDRFSTGDAGAGLVLLVAGAVALLGLRATLAVLLTVGARAAAALHHGSGRALAAAALRCSPRALRLALAGSLTGLVVTGSLTTGALAVAAATGPAPRAGQESAVPASVPAAAPSPGWPVTEEPDPAPEHSPGWPVDPGTGAPDDPESEPPAAPGPDEDRTRSPGPPDEPGAEPEGPRPRTVTVSAGDSLWSIAAEMEGTRDPAAVASAVAAIHRENRAVIGSDPNLILPGSRLEIP
ncbi:resuscitation-promoting factor RpfA [Brevibacterium pityocampae]